MTGIYDSILKAYNELKEKGELKSVTIENVGETVRAEAVFRAGGALDITVSVNPAPRLEKAISKYGGKVLHYGAKHDTLLGRDLFKVKVKQEMLVDKIEAELPEKIGAKDANALKSTLDLLKIPYEIDGRRLSVGTWRLHRKVKATDCGKVFDAISGSGAKYPYLVSAGNDSNVYASSRGIFVTLELGEKESEQKRKKRMDELQAFLECDTGCEILDGYELRFYSFSKEGAPGKPRGRSTVIA